MDSHRRRQGNGRPDHVAALAFEGARCFADVGERRRQASLRMRYFACLVRARRNNGFD